MTQTNNLDNKYTVDVITDPTGGDGTPTTSGYENKYIMKITPKPGEDIFAGDFKIESLLSTVDSDATPTTPHGVTTSYDHIDVATGAQTNDSYQMYTFPASGALQAKNIETIDIYEVYADTDGNPTSVKNPTGKPETEVIFHIELEINLTQSFLSTPALTSTTIDIDIDMFTGVVFGCTDDQAFNYNEFATVDDGSCIPKIYGCTDTNALNYDPNANTDDGSCIAKVFGCTDPAAINYAATANFDDGSCCFVAGCTDPAATNYDPNACIDDGSCVFPT